MDMGRIVPAIVTTQRLSRRSLGPPLRRKKHVPNVPASDIGPGPVQPLLVDPLVGRSGSTLLMSILATSPAIAFDRVHPYEHRYLTYLIRLVQNVDGTSLAPPGWNMTQLLEGPLYQIGPIPFRPVSVDPADLAVRLTRHLWAAFTESILMPGKEPRRYYAEKTWGDALEVLAKAGINVKLINLVRDPRDVAASIRAFDDKRGYYGFGRQPGQSDVEYLDALVDRIKRSLQRMEQRAGCHEHAWVRYEDLVADPRRVVERLSSWLGVALDPGPAEPRGKNYRRHATTASPMASVGRWRNELSTSAVACIEGALGREMRRFEYHCSES